MNLHLLVALTMLTFFSVEAGINGQAWLNNPGSPIGKKRGYVCAMCILFAAITFAAILTFKE